MLTELPQHEGLKSRWVRENDARENGHHYINQRTASKANAFFST